MTKEELLKIWLTTEPKARSPYKINGCPPMFETLKYKDGTELFTCPGIVMAKVGQGAYAEYSEVEGVRWQWQRDGNWIGQGHCGSFHDFEKMVGKGINHADA